MREFVFEIGYESGADPVMDVFIEYDDLVSSSLDGCVGDDAIWRVERISGPRTALDRLEDLHRSDTFGDVLTETDDVRRDADVLEESATERVFYTYLENVGATDAIHTLAKRYLPAGLLFETTRRGHRHRWRVLTRSDERIGLLYDTLGAKIPPDRSFHFDRLGEAERWQRDALAAVSLPAAQRTALAAAAERGYYETPREISLQELSDQLAVPRSTLSYRLRRAEAALVHDYLGT